MDTERCDIESFQESACKDGHILMSVSIEDIKEALKDKPKINPAEKLPNIYHEYLDVFSQDEANKLAPHRPSDHRIVLKPGSEPP